MQKEGTKKVSSPVLGVLLLSYDKYEEKQRRYNVHGDIMCSLTSKRVAEGNHNVNCAFDGLDKSLKLLFLLEI